MFCSKCGAQIPDGSTFCNKCGEKIIKEPVINTVSITEKDLIIQKLTDAKKYYSHIDEINSEINQYRADIDLLNQNYAKYKLVEVTSKAKFFKILPAIAILFFLIGLVIFSSFTVILWFNSVAAWVAFIVLNYRDKNLMKIAAEKTKNYQATVLTPGIEQATKNIRIKEFEINTYIESNKSILAFLPPKFSDANHVDLIYSMIISGSAKTLEEAYTLIEKANL